MPWIPRGLREGIVTSRYPRRPDGYGEPFRGAVMVEPGGSGRDRDGGELTALAAEACPTEAISIDDGHPRLDRGRCILCGRCTELQPEVFRFDPMFETSTVGRRALIVPQVDGDEDEDEAALERTKAELGRRVKALRRSVQIRHVDAGSDGAEEWEVAALTNPVYDVHRLGIFFTASPRHADLLLATGVGSAGMQGPLKETFEVMPDPKVVIAAGVDAISGGLLGSGYVARGGVTESLPVDVYVPGSPPSPFGLLYGILLAVGLLPEEHGKAKRHATISRPSDRPGGAPHGPVSPEDPPREAGP